MTAKKAPEKPLLSGAHLAPSCDRDLCDGYRAWPTPAGKTVEGHCWCPTGRAQPAGPGPARRSDRSGVMTITDLPPTVARPTVADVRDLLTLAQSQLLVVRTHGQAQEHSVHEAANLVQRALNELHKGARR